LRRLPAEEGATEVTDEQAIVIAAAIMAGVEPTSEDAVIRARRLFEINRELDAPKRKVQEDMDRSFAEAMDRSMAAL
jgi:hypothetical protein